MAVRKRKDTGNWEVSLNLDGKRIRLTSPTQTKTGAKKFETELVQKHVASLISKGSSEKQAKIEDFAVTWLETYVAVNKRPSSLVADEAMLRIHILPFFRGKTLDQISSFDVERFKAAQLKKGLKEKSINNHLAVLRKMLSTAKEWGYKSEVPTIRWFRGRAGRVDFLTAEESTRLLAQVEDRWHSILFTALRTGMRRGELIALKWCCVDFGRGTILVEQSDWKGILGPTKNGDSRIIPMSKELQEVLKKHRKTAPRSEFVFCNADGSRLKFTQMKRPIYRACKKADLRKMQWHTFRHTFASHLVMANVGIRTVQELMGHKSLEMTLRYSHLAPSTLVEAVDKLDEFAKKAKAEPDLRVVKDSA